MLLLTPPHSEWDSFCARIGLTDVHFTAAYAGANQIGGRAFMAVDFRNKIVKPFLLRDIADSIYRDVVSLYGYGGMTGLGIRSPDAEAKFDAELVAWLRSVGVVSEFCVHHPLLSVLQDTSSPELPSQSVRKRVVTVDLTKSQDAILAGMRADRRAKIAKAIEGDSIEAVTTPVTDISGMAAFHDLYEATMTRVAAANRYQLPESYFRGYEAVVGAQLFFTLIDGTPESAALVIGQGANAYYHFAGNSMLHPKSGANDLLIYEIAMWARSNRFKVLHLGGGSTDAPDDPLLFYKGCFSADRHDVKVSFRVIDQPTYDELTMQTYKRIGEAAFYASTFEPSYRRT